jgi:hypothetical protein
LKRIKGWLMLASDDPSVELEEGGDPFIVRIPRGCPNPSISIGYEKVNNGK